MPKNQLLSPRRWVPKRGPPSQVLDQEEWQGDVLLREVPAFIVLFNFPSEGEGRVLICPKMHLLRVVYVCLLTAPCCKLLCFGGQF